MGNGPGTATAVAVSGDATLSNTGALTVTGIDGKAISGTASSGQSLEYNGTNWVPYTPASGTLSGSGTTGYVPNYTAANVLADSPIFVSGSNVGIGTASPASKLDVSGTIDLNGTYGLWDDTTNGNLAVGNTAMSTTVSQAGGGGNGTGVVAVGNLALNANTTGGYPLLVITPSALIPAELTIQQ